MNIAELKLDLIQKVIDTNDVELLIKIKAFLDGSDEFTNEVNEPSTAYPKTEKVLIFNEWQQERINRALEQYENGECISDEEAEIEMQKWFKEEEERLLGQ